jgi:hypothetical protein
MKRDRRGDLEIDDQIELRGLLDWKKNGCVPGLCFT